MNLQPLRPSNNLHTHQAGADNITPANPNGIDMQQQANNLHRPQPAQPAGIHNAMHAALDPRGRPLVAHGNNPHATPGVNTPMNTMSPNMINPVMMNNMNGMNGMPMMNGMPAMNMGGMPTMNGMPAMNGMPGMNTMPGMNGMANGMARPAAVDMIGQMIRSGQMSSAYKYTDSAGADANFGAVTTYASPEEQAQSEYQQRHNMVLNHYAQFTQQYASDFYNRGKLWENFVKSMESYRGQYTMQQTVQFVENFVVRLTTDPQLRATIGLNIGVIYACHMTFLTMKEEKLDERTHKEICHAINCNVAAMELASYLNQTKEARFMLTQENTLGEIWLEKLREHTKLIEGQVIAAFAELNLPCPYEKLRDEVKIGIDYSHLAAAGVIVENPNSPEVLAKEVARQRRIYLDSTVRPVDDEMRLQNPQLFVKGDPETAAYCGDVPPGTPGHCYVDINNNFCYTFDERYSVDFNRKLYEAERERIGKALTRDIEERVRRSNQPKQTVQEVTFDEEKFKEQQQRQLEQQQRELEEQQAAVAEQFVDFSESFTTVSAVQPNVVVNGTLRTDYENMTMDNHMGFAWHDELVQVPGKNLYTTTKDILDHLRRVFFHNEGRLLRASSTLVTVFALTQAGEPAYASDRVFPLKGRKLETFLTNPELLLPLLESADDGNVDDVSRLHLNVDPDEQYDLAAVRMQALEARRASLIEVSEVAYSDLPTHDEEASIIHAEASEAAGENIHATTHVEVHYTTATLSRATKVNEVYRKLPNLVKGTEVNLNYFNFIRKTYNTVAENFIDEPDFVMQLDEYLTNEFNRHMVERYGFDNTPGSDFCFEINTLGMNTDQLIQMVNNVCPEAYEELSSPATSGTLIEKSQCFYTRANANKLMEANKRKSRMQKHMEYDNNLRIQFVREVIVTRISEMSPPVSTPLDTVASVQRSEHPDFFKVIAAAYGDATKRTAPGAEQVVIFSRVGGGRWSFNTNRYDRNNVGTLRRIADTSNLTMMRLTQTHRAKAK